MIKISQIIKQFNLGWVQTGALGWPEGGHGTPAICLSAWVSVPWLTTGRPKAPVYIPASHRLLQRPEGGLSGFVQTEGGRGPVRPRADGSRSEPQLLIATTCPLDGQDHAGDHNGKGIHAGKCWFCSFADWYLQTALLRWPKLSWQKHMGRGGLADVRVQSHEGLCM